MLRGAMELRTMRRVAPLPKVGAVLWLAAVHLLILGTGGRPNMLSALACLPIALGALAGGWRGGLAMALMAMALYGPLTPVRASEGDAAHDLADWLVRSGEFLTAGLVLGYFATRSARLTVLLDRSEEHT